MLALGAVCPASAGQKLESQPALEGRDFFEAHGHIVTEAIHHTGSLTDQRMQALGVMVVVATQ